MDNPHNITPQDAKNMKCPMSFNAVTTDDDHYLCLGPKCMAWRWREEDYVGKIENSNVSIDIVRQRYSTTHGYCGMVRI